MSDYRPFYHITPKTGWINDPNGFAWFKGRYHLYCQHNPLDTKWGPMHWLHFVSDDLLHFEEVGISLKPDHPYDLPWGCFSGSAIAKDGKLYVLYTGASEGKQQQCLAISEDGHEFRKYEGNPVIGESDLPQGYLIADFRDPKVFEKEGRYYVLLAARHKDGYSSILLYSSVDLIHFSFVGVVKSFHNCQKGGMIECPDILFDGEKTALLYSLQHPLREGEGYQNSFLVAYVIGHLDLQSGAFIEEGPEREIDVGFACYASQSLHRDGKNYLVFWQSSWDIVVPTDEGYAGQLSLIKEVHIVGDRIKMGFLPGSGQQKMVIDVTSNKASVHINNLELLICKKENKVTLIRHGVKKDNKRFFHLEDTSRISIEYAYDRSCVEISFQDGEAFVSLLNFKDASMDKPTIKTKGCKVI